MNFIFIFSLVLLVQAGKRFELRSQFEKSLSTNHQKDFNSTVTGMEKLNKIIRRILKMEKIVNETEEENQDMEERPLENPDLFQGDLILTESQMNSIIDNEIKKANEINIDVSDIANISDSRSKRSLLYPETFEWTFPIPYYVYPQVSSAIVDASLREISQETCVTFTKNTAPIVGKSGIHYINGTGCGTYVGRTSETEPEEVSISTGCGTITIVQHETAHVLGLEHEQTRMDRDQYLIVNLTNGMLTAPSQINKLTNERTFGVPYDYGSNMQYHRLAYSANGLPTMLPINGLYGRTLGSGTKLSFNDIKLINARYCSTVCPTAKECFMGGYQDPNKCGYCKCPDGYIGTACLTKVLNATVCGTQQFTATTTTQTLSISGAKDCYYYINTDKGYKIQLNGVTTNLTHYDACYMGKGAEIKFKEDKTVAGIRLCGVNSNINIITEIQDVIIRYVGGSGHSFKLSYVRAQ
uniref:Zinc metalloproteinase n=1 Tax=Parastrongyloides trichosuri TaxID=131310 RepID=A0A0N4ZAM3_PARTI